MKKVCAIILVSLLGYIIYAKYYMLKQADYIFIGKYNYSITNWDSLNATYLSKNSLGFLIGSLPIQGIAIQNLNISESQDYIFSLDHPIKAVYMNSYLTRNEGQEHLIKKPVEIIKDTLIKDQYMYVYKITPTGKYRLLLP